MPDDIVHSILTRRAPQGGSQTVNLDARTVDAILSTGAIVRRREWDCDYDEELVTGGADLSRSMPLLFDHRTFDSNAIVGRVERPRLEKGQLVGTLRFSAEEPGPTTLRKIADGTIAALSIGYSVEKFETIQRAGDVPLRRVIKWTPREVSIVPLAADPGAKFRSLNSFPKEIAMPDPVATSATPTPAPAPSNVEELTRAAVMAERNRVLAIDARVHELSRTGSLAAEDGETIRRDLITRGTGLEHVGNILIDEIAARGSQRVSWPRVEGGADYTDPTLRRNLMAEALAARSSPLVKASEPARQFMNMGVPDVAREILIMRGDRLGFLPPGDLITRALTTSDFPLLLANVGSKTLLAAYMAAPAGILEIARRTTAPDFKTKHQLRLGEAPTPAKVNEAGEFTYGSLAESDETYKVEEYGKMLKLTRPVLVNDDLSAFTQLTTMFADAARELEAQTIVDLLTSASGAGPTMSDALALFHATHGNLAASGGAIDVTTVGAGRAAMRSQKGLSGRPVNVVPKFLVTNAAKETLGEQVLSTIYAAKVSDANPFSERLSLVVDPRLDAKSATAWYMAADTNQAAIEYAHLEGEEGPKVELREGWTTSGVEVRCYMTFGAGAVDFRGIYRNPGA